MRRMLLRMTTKDVNKFMVSVLKHLAERSPASIGEDLARYLSEQAAETRVWPSDAAIASQLPQIKLYYNVRQSRLRLVLESIEAHLRRRDPRFGAMPVPSGLSLEHVMPRAWRHHWEASPPLSPGDAARRDALVDTLGNLTLVEQSLNSSLSNRPWGDTDATDLREGGQPGRGKRSLLEQFNLLVLNKQVLDRSEPWNDAAIQARSAALAEAVCEIWPGPDDEVQRAANDDRLQPPPSRQEGGTHEGRREREPWSDEEIQALARRVQLASGRLLDHLAANPGTWWNGSDLTDAGAAVNPHGTVGAISIAVDAHLKRANPISFRQIEGRWHWALEEDFAARWVAARSAVAT